MSLSLLCAENLPLKLTLHGHEMKERYNLCQRVPRPQSIVSVARTRNQTAIDRSEKKSPVSAKPEQNSWDSIRHKKTTSPSSSLSGKQNKYTRALVQRGNGSRQDSDRQDGAVCKEGGGEHLTKEGLESEDVITGCEREVPQSNQIFCECESETRCRHKQEHGEFSRTKK